MSLQGKEKLELLGFIQKILREYPALVDELAAPDIPSNAPAPEEVDAFSRRIRKIIRSDLDYYAINGAINPLTPLKKCADGIVGQEILLLCQAYFQLNGECL